MTDYITKATAEHDRWMSVPAVVIETLRQCQSHHLDLANDFKARLRDRNWRMKEIHVTHLRNGVIRHIDFANAIERAIASLEETDAP